MAADAILKNQKIAISRPQFDPLELSDS